VSLVDDRLDSAVVVRHMPKHIVTNICDHVSMSICFMIASDFFGRFQSNVSIYVRKS
jgi:hypothetical protein